MYDSFLNDTLLKKQIEQEKNRNFQLQKELEGQKLILENKKKELIEDLKNLYDTILLYKDFSFGKLEIEESAFLEYDDSMLESQPFEVLTLDGEILLQQQKRDIILQFKKSFTMENEQLFFSPEHKYKFSLALKNLFKVVYWLGIILNIELPYKIYIDRQGYPQFQVYKIFEQSFHQFQIDSLNNLQMNIYYLFYRLGVNLDKILQENQYLNVDDLLKKALNNETNRNKKRNNQIQIQRAKIQIDKFEVPQQQDDDSDDSDIIIID